MRLVVISENRVVPLDQAGEAIGTGLNIWMRRLIERFSPLLCSLRRQLLTDPLIFTFYLLNCCTSPANMR